MFYDYMIQMYNGILQSLDLHLEVSYPIDYIAKAIPMDAVNRDQILRTSRMLLLHEPTTWINYMREGMFYHPREIAKALLE
jgi:hypothetical protein